MITTVATDLYNRIKDNVPAVNDRVYTSRTRQEVDKPYINISQAANMADYTHSGRSDYNETRFLISVYSDSGVEAAGAIADTVETILESWTETYNLKAYQMNRFEQYEQDTQLDSVIMDYTVKYS